MSEVDQDIEEIIPKHIAIIMDGNGRWAKKRLLPRKMGHKRGLDALEKVISFCLKKRINHLTVFAFSTENWQRPEDEISYLMSLFLIALQKRIQELNENNIKLNIVGRIDRFSPEIAEAIIKAEELTAKNSGLVLSIAADYGGQWDIIQAVNSLLKMGVKEINEDNIKYHLSLANLPNPDLFIRTGGEMRISNFMLWQLAYTELYFTESLWPDFDEVELNKALDCFKSRERRYGRILE